MHINNLQITSVKENQLSIIQQLATKIWPVAYKAILAEKQLQYMLETFYSIASLKEQLNNKKHFFLLIYDSETPIGFASYSFDCETNAKTKLHKIYVLPEMQGKGAGVLLLKHIEEKAKEKQQEFLFLNVNRFNKAILFYEKLGFSIVKSEDIAIGNGYLMEDYVMEKKLK